VDQWQAYQILSRRLHFGDDDQISARAYLAQIARARARLMTCRWCGGVGVLISARSRRQRLCPCIALEGAEVTRDLGIGVDS
jgi:hypothetical protein